MSQHDDILYIQDMKSFSLEAISLIQGITQDDLRRNRVLQLAIVKLLENVGEASTKISASFKGKFSSIPWDEMRGMRNRLIHGYNRINLDIVYRTCNYDLPSLLVELEKIELG
jgi:uncharacterized protein with HEPN domain